MMTVVPPRHSFSRCRRVGLLDAVQAGAVGEHPAGEDLLVLFLLVDLVDLGEHVGLRRLRQRARVAGRAASPAARQIAPSRDRDLKGDDAAGDLVESLEHRGRVADLVGQRRAGNDEAGERGGGDERKPAPGGRTGARRVA